MRILRIGVMILSICLVAVAVFLELKEIDSKTAPVITCKSDDVIRAKIGVTDNELLTYVGATDDKDGDISDRIVVERKMYFLKRGLTSVVFSVSDSDNNVSRIQRKLEFTDYVPPRIGLKGDLIIHKGVTADISGLFTATDVYDGNVRDRLKLVTSDYSYLVPGAYDVNCKVTNSFGDTENITVKVYVVEEDYSAVTIRLSSYMEYFEAGKAKPDFKSYVSDVINSKVTGFVPDDVVVDDSGFDASKEGVYDIFYSIKDEKETVTKTRLIAVVKEDGE